MLKRLIDSVVGWLKRVINQPREELNRWQHAVLFAYDLARFGTRQLQHDRAPQMAAALSFRALFGLVPVLVVATLLVKALIGVDEFLLVIQHALAAVGLDDVLITHPTGSSTGSQSLADWLGNLITEAAGVRLSAIGWVGLVVVSYAAVSLLSTIEDAFNIIYRVSNGRPWITRVPLYWFLLTVSPIAIGLGTWIDNRFENWLMAVDTWPWALAAAQSLWIAICGWLVMLTVYMLMPSAKVGFKPAAIGALVTVILVEIGKRGLGASMQNAISISQLYGSLGLIPLFMFWTYLMWLAVLFGLQVSAILQKLHGRRLGEIERRHELTGLIEPASVITVMEVVAERFARGKRTTSDQIADAASFPRSTVAPILDHLVDQGLLHRLESENEAVSLSLPADQITAAQLIDVGFQMVDESGIRRSSFFDRLRDAQRDLAGEQTLANLLVTPK
jgi:membrane protein